MKYNVIISDPPWSFGDSLKKMKRKVKRSAVSQYKIMTIDQIKDIDVPSIVDQKGCLMVMWVPSSMLQEGLQVLNHWGFTFKGTYMWVKLKKNSDKEPDPNKRTRVGMGRLFRQSHEIAIIGVRGKIYGDLKNKSQRSVCFALNEGHSKKPDNLHKSLELMFPNANRLEMFARKTRSDWDQFGDALTGIDINESIERLSAEEE